MPRKFLSIVLASAGLVMVPGLSRPAVAADEPEKPATRPATRPGTLRLNVSEVVDRLEAALKDVKLSDEQKAKLNDAMAKARKAFAEASENGSGEARQRFQQVMKAVDDLRDSVQGAMDEEQFKALADKLPFLKRRRPATRPAGEGPGGAAAAPGEQFRLMRQAAAEVLEKFSLTDEQKKQFQALNEDVEKRVREAVGELKDDWPAINEKLRPILEERRKRLAEILTGEQLAKYQELMQEQVRKLRESRETPRKTEEEEKK